MPLHDTADGLILVQSRGRPSNVQKRQMACSEYINTAIEDLRQSLRLTEQSKICLILSCATTEMIQLVSMHPEVWFMDVTFGTNVQKQRLFVGAVRSPTRGTFPFNLTVICSERKWVFDTIYRQAFIALYGATTVSRNRLALFDEDAAEYGPFENCIATMDEYKNSSVMLCSFHAVYTPFKKDVLSKFPRKSSASGELTLKGRIIGEEFIISFMCLSHMLSFSH